MALQNLTEKVARKFSQTWKGNQGEIQQEKTEIWEPTGKYIN